MIQKEDTLVKRQKLDADADTVQADELRQASLETFGVTLKRKGDEEFSTKRRRSSGTETINYLKEKSEVDAELKREKLSLKRKELEEKTKSQETIPWLRQVK